MKKEKKIKKVELTYENGSKKYIKGNDAQKWFETINSAIFFEQTHFGREGVQKQLKKFNWRKANSKKSKHYFKLEEAN